MFHSVSVNIFLVECLFVDLSFDTKTKEFKDFATDGFLREVSEEIRLPTFAIGGITCDNIDRLLHLGLKRFAVASSIADAADPGEEVRRMCSLMCASMENQSPKNL